MTDAHFGGPFPFPALRPDHPLYSDEGHYWQGGRWPSTMAMAIQGFQNSGRPDLAGDLAGRVLGEMSEVSREYEKQHGRGTVAEFYGIHKLAAGLVEPIVGIEPGHKTRLDFAGWGMVPPVHNNLEQLVGLRPVAGYAGDTSAGRDKWIESLMSSPLWRNMNYLSGLRNAGLKGDPKQRELAAQGYMEWNLSVDPGKDKVEAKSLVYENSLIENLEIHKLKDRVFEVRVRSAKKFNLQVNQLFDGTHTAASPVVGSQIVTVGGEAGEVFTLRLSKSLSE